MRGFVDQGRRKRKGIKGNLKGIRARSGERRRIRILLVSKIIIDVAPNDQSDNLTFSFS